MISKSSVSKDLHEKYELYEDAGVKEYWVIQPRDKTLAIYHLNENGRYAPSKLLTKGDIATSQTLVGFKFDLNDLFEDMVKEPEEPYGPNVKRI